MTERDSQIISNRFNLAGAIVCALCVAFVQTMLLRDSMTPLRLRDFAAASFISLLTYVCVWMLTTRYWSRPFSLFLPNPVLIALAGALISAHLLEVQFVIAALSRPRPAGQGIGDFLLLRWNAVFFLALIYSIVGLPIMGAVWGIGLVIRMLRKETKRLMIAPR